MDTYGHWWIEFDGESYGWWPKYGVSSIRKTILGVDGKLNGLEVLHVKGLASSTRDYHHGDSAHQQFHPKVDTRKFFNIVNRKLEYGKGKGIICRCATEDEIKDSLREFSKAYSGSWSFPWGQNCHSFQKAAMKASCLKE